MARLTWHIFFLFVLIASAVPARAETMPPLLSPAEASAAKTYLKQPKPGERLPAALAKSPHGRAIETLHSWALFQDNRVDKLQPQALVASATRLQELPRFKTTKRRVENQLSFDDPPDTILGWFAITPPSTGKGQLLKADALIRSNVAVPEQTVKIQAGWRRAWLDYDEEDTFLARHRARLRPEDHSARARFLMAYEGYSAARRMVARLPADEAKLLNARLKLRGFQAGVDAAVKQVPAALQTDPALTLDRAYWRRKRKLNDAAMLLLKPDLDAMALERPQRLWTERHFWARRLLKEKKYERAYALASNHNLIAQLPDGTPTPSALRVAFAEAEWLSGWLALRFLDRPAAAYGHFQTMFNNVTTPISRTRGAYWLGRTALALQDEDLARYWLRRAAGMPHRYYGRLAAEMLDEPPSVMALRVEDVRPAEADALYAALLDREDAVYLRLLKEAGRDDLVGVFISDIAWKQTAPEDVYLLSRFGAALGRPDLPLKVAKKLEAQGIVYQDAGYPTIALSKRLKELAPLMHAIARQESVFNPTVVSRAGAQGLMQLMPATAKRTARKHNLPYRFSRLTEDPAYNMQLASHYLNFLAETFDDTVPLMVAGYNAGENAVLRWTRDYGLPQDQDVDAIDWMERIPYSETRNYVQRVLEALVIYQDKLSPQNARTLHAIVGSTAGVAGGR
ncbi:MAG: lytic transglycosylase domain-containing protein [Pseudomonadota bacterium]